MSEIRVARRYAKSFIEIAQEENLLEEIHNDMEFVRNTIEGSRELELVLKSPVVNSGKKRQVLEAVFSSHLSKITDKFFHILVRKGREGFLPEISRQFHLLYNEINAIEIAEVQTPFELTDTLREEFIQLVKEVSGKPNVELKEVVSEDLIGGYVLRVRDRQIDDSVRTRLSSLRQEMLG